MPEWGFSCKFTKEIIDVSLHNNKTQQLNLIFLIFFFWHQLSEFQTLFSCSTQKLISKVKLEDDHNLSDDLGLIPNRVFVLMCSWWHDTLINSIFKNNFNLTLNKIPEVKFEDWHHRIDDLGIIQFLKTFLIRLILISWMKDVKSERLMIWELMKKKI